MIWLKDNIKLDNLTIDVAAGARLYYVEAMSYTYSYLNDENKKAISDSKKLQVVFNPDSHSGKVDAIQILENK